MGFVPFIGGRIFCVGETVVTEGRKMSDGCSPETHVFEPQMSRREGHGSIADVDNAADMNMSRGTERMEDIRPVRRKN